MKNERGFGDLSSITFTILSVRRYKIVLTLRSVDETLLLTIQMKAIEQYFHVVLFYKVVLTLKSVGETLVYSPSNESYREVFSCAVQRCSIV